MENDKTSHVTGFTFVVLGIIHLAGGKITEGMPFTLDNLLFTICYQQFFIKHTAFLWRNLGGYPIVCFGLQKFVTKCAFP